LENGEDMKTLQKRLSVLPAGLEPLYRRMVEQIDPFYHTHAAQIFRMVQSTAQPLSPLAMSFAEDNPRDALLEGGDIFSVKEIVDRQSKVAKRLKARTAGLTEISPLKRKSHGSNWLTNNKGDPPSESISRKIEQISWEPSRIQYLHLTVKEFLRSDSVPTWLATQISQPDADAHLRIVACCLRQFRATGSFHLYDYSEINRYDSSDSMAYCHATRDGIVFMIMFHALEVERITKASQLPYLEALDTLVMAHKPPCPDRISGYDEYGNEIRESRQWHWTLDRYADWVEPREWLSDYVSYLITIGMTRSVIDKFNRGYNPASKPGRPLLHYATCSLAPGYAVTDFERDTLDPAMVEELLKRKCDPNQSFEPPDRNSIRYCRTWTVWEAVLVEICARFSGDWANTEAMYDLRLRWLKTIKLFLDYGADPAQFVIDDYNGPRGWERRYPEARVSALLILNRTFEDFDDPLVESIRNLMISKGATEVDEQDPQSDPRSGNL